MHRKNEERTRKVTPKLMVSVRLDSVSLMTSSSGVLPRRSSRDHSSALSVVRKRSFVVSIHLYHHAVSVMSVSLPAECYRMAPAPSLGVLRERYMYIHGHNHLPCLYTDSTFIRGAGGVCVHHSWSYCTLE